MGGRKFDELPPGSRVIRCEKAHILVNVFLDSLNMAAHRSKACEEQVALADVLKETHSDKY